MINNVAKLLKNMNSLIQAEIAAWHTSHDRNEKIHCYLPRIYQENCDKKKHKIVKNVNSLKQREVEMVFGCHHAAAAARQSGRWTKKSLRETKVEKKQKIAFSKKACGHATQQKKM